MSLQVWVDSGGKCVMQQVFKPSENFDFSNIVRNSIMIHVWHCCKDLLIWETLGESVMVLIKIK
jgi:hypothetical protein